MSLISGWLPIAVQLAAALVLLLAVGRRSRRWWLLAVPIAAAVGVLAAVAGHRFVVYQGWGDEPNQIFMWVWIGVTGFAVAALVAGWRGSTWWRRTLAVLAVPLCALCAAFALNTATGYFPTVKTAWQRITDTQPPQWIDQSELAQMQRDGERPTRGTLVWMQTPSDKSGFEHRKELVYLPPAWFASDPPPKLPVILAIGAEFSHPSDWLDAGDALTTLDDFAAAHHGNSPVIVFPDSSGTFSNDTECVNGARGRAADHLTDEVVPYVKEHFGVSTDAANWGVMGWSSGGTCSLTLGLLHPELFRAIVDLDGQLGPNAGTKEQTVARLFDGDVDAWAAFDPKTIAINHGPYKGMSAWMGVSEETDTKHYPPSPTPPAADAFPDWDPYSEHHADTANTLCTLLSGYGIECSVVSYPGTHDFSSAGDGLADALPWLAGKIGTPGVDVESLPGVQ